MHDYFFLLNKVGKNIDYLTSRPFKTQQLERKIILLVYDAPSRKAFK